MVGIPPLKMVMAGGWFIIVWPTLPLFRDTQKLCFFFFASPIWGCTDVFLLNYYCVLVPYLRGWFSLGLGLRDGLCLPLEVVNRKSGIQLQSSVFIISPDHSWGIVGNCWSISQQWWMNWRTGTSWANGVVFSCQISEIWFHGIGNTFIQIYISYVYFYLFKN